MGCVDDTGTHHSGYNPKASTYDGTNTDQDQGQSEGVRGAPIQGDNVKVVLLLLARS